MKHIEFDTNGFEIGDKVKFRPNARYKLQRVGIIRDFEINATFSDIGSKANLVCCWILSDDNLRYKVNVNSNYLQHYE